MTDPENVFDEIQEWDGTDDTDLPPLIAGDPHVLAAAVRNSILRWLQDDLPLQIGRLLERETGKLLGQLQDLFDKAIAEFRAQLDTLKGELAESLAGLGTDLVGDFNVKLAERERLLERRQDELAARVSGLTDMLTSLRLTSEKAPVFHVPPAPAPVVTVSVPPLGTRTKQISYDDLGRPVSIMETDTSYMELDPDLDLPEDLSDEHE